MFVPARHASYGPRHTFRRRRASANLGVRRVITATVASLILLALPATKVYGSLHADSRAVRVHPGDTLWSIAAANYDSDTRDRMDDIASVNGITDGQVHAGEVLTLP